MARGGNKGTGDVRRGNKDIRGDEPNKRKKHRGNEDESDDNQSRVNDSEWENTVADVESIIQLRGKGKNTEYRVKYKSGDLSWETRDFFLGTSKLEKMLRDYEVMIGEDESDDEGKAKKAGRKVSKTTGSGAGQPVRRRRRLNSDELEELEEEKRGSDKLYSTKFGATTPSLLEQYTEITKNRPKPEEFEQVSDPNSGNFTLGDSPDGIIFSRAETSLGTKEVILIFIVTWKQRSNGTMPKPTEYSNKELKKQCPQLLIAFYENKVRFGGAGGHSAKGFNTVGGAQGTQRGHGDTIFNLIN